MSPFDISQWTPVELALLIAAHQIDIVFEQQAPRLAHRRLCFVLIRTLGKGEQFPHEADHALFLITGQRRIRRRRPGTGNGLAAQSFTGTGKGRAMGRLMLRLQNLIDILVGHFMPEGVQNRSPGIFVNVPCADHETAMRTIPGAQSHLAVGQFDDRKSQGVAKKLVIVVFPPLHKRVQPRITQLGRRGARHLRSASQETERRKEDVNRPWNTSATGPFIVRE